MTSGTISGLVSAIVAIIIVYLWGKISPGTFGKFVAAVWGFLKPIATYQVSIWYALALVAAWYFVTFLIQKYKPQKNVDADEVWKKIIGNYNFRDLSNILLGEFLSANKIPGSSVDNAVVNFYKYAVRFNEGLGPTTLHDGGFAYNELAPNLALHRLVDKRADTYYLNDNGNLLYASLATTFINYPDYKTKVYSIQVRYVPPLPDVTYTQNEVNGFILTQLPKELADIRTV